MSTQIELEILRARLDELEELYLNISSSFSASLTGSGTTGSASNATSSITFYVSGSNDVLSGSSFIFSGSNIFLSSSASTNTIFISASANSASASSLQYLSISTGSIVASNGTFSASIITPSGTSDPSLAEFLILDAKTSGSILARKPASLGAARMGLKSVDLQSEDHYISGGTRTVQGDYNVIAGGYGNITSGSYSSIGGGLSNSADAEHSTIPGGAGAGAQKIKGKLAYSSDSSINSGGAATFGMRQTGILVTYGVSTSTTAVDLTSDGNALSLHAGSSFAEKGSNTNSIFGWGSFAVKALIVAQDVGAYSAAAWEINCLVKRTGGKGTVTLVGSQTKTLISADTAASTWDADLVADTSYGSIKARVTGENSKTIRWVCTMYTTEVNVS
jgi:hypothetical protein